MSLNPAYKMRSELTPLMTAIADKNYDLFDRYVQWYDVNEQNRYGVSPLHIACDEGTYDEFIISKLLEYGADGSVTTVDGVTPLHLAARYATYPLGIYSLIAFSNPNIRVHGMLPVDIARAYNRRPEIISALSDVTYNDDMDYETQDYEETKNESQRKSHNLLS